MVAMGPGFSFGLHIQVVAIIKKLLSSTVTMQVSLYKQQPLVIVLSLKETGLNSIKFGQSVYGS